MTIAYKASGTMSSGAVVSTSSAAVDMPAGVVAGDTLVSFFNIGQFGATGVTFPTGIPSGWSTLGTSTAPNQMGSAVYYKVATGSEGASQTWSGWGMTGTSNWYYHWIIMAFSGGDSSTPIQPTEWSKTTNTNTTAAQTHPTVTPTVDGSGVILYRLLYSSSGAQRSFTSSITSAGAPAGVERSDPGGSFVPQMAIYTRDGGFALADQSYTTTSNLTGSGGNHMWSIILNSEPPPPFTPPSPTVVSRVAIERSYAW